VEPVTGTAAALNAILSDPGVVAEVVLREVPMLADEWGARDEDALVHSLGMNLLAALGRSARYPSITEFPVPRAAGWEGKLVRVDAAWFDRDTQRPVLLAEFERYSLDTVLEKLTNLYVAGHAFEAAPEVLLLCLWALDGETVETGWYAPGRPLAVPGGPVVEKPAGAHVVLAQAVFGRRGEDLYLLRLRRLG
jgi:hypothetical protein